MDTVVVTLVGGMGLGAAPPVAGGVLPQLFAAGGISTVFAYVLSAVAALGALIFIHELGHFLVAKAMGVGVERFSLGFGPRLWSCQRGETEYCVSVVPLGGYVKMVGEEAFGEELVHPAAEPRAPLAKSFTLKPLGTRALIVFAGPGMNFVLAIAVFSIIFAAVGVPVLSSTVGQVPAESPAAAAGLQLGDTILAIDTTSIRHWGEIEERIQGSDGQVLALTVARDGEQRELSVTPQRVPGQTLFGEPTTVWSIGVGPYLPPVVGEVLPGRPAAEAGLRPGDRIVALDGEPIDVWDQLVETISQRAGQPVTLTIERGDDERLDITVTPGAETQQDPLGEEIEVGRIGIVSAAAQTFLRSDPFSAVWQGVERTFDLTVLTVVSLGKLVTGSISARQIGGPLQIGVLAGQQAQQGFVSYAFFVALISINLAVINLLPVPILDGGHLLFFAVEGILGRPLSVRKREIAQQIGLGLVMLLIVFAIFNDITRLLPIGKLFE